MYNYKLGTYETFSGDLRRFVDKVVLIAIGGALGIIGGLYVVVAQIQAAVQPIITQDSSSSLLPVAISVSMPDDLQPASGYNTVQHTERPQS